MILHSRSFITSVAAVQRLQRDLRDAEALQTSDRIKQLVANYKCWEDEVPNSSAARPSLGRNKI